jgi:hypothetical protein
MALMSFKLGETKFCQLGDFMKYSHSKAMAVFHKIVKLVKNGVSMIIHIYAKVSPSLKLIKAIPFLPNRPLTRHRYAVVRYFDCDEPTNLISNTAFWF